MNKDYFNSAVLFAAQTGLSVDKESGIIFGNYGGYDTTVSLLGDSKTIRASFFVKRGTEAPSLSELQQLAKIHKNYFGICTVAGYRVDFNLKPAVFSVGKTVTKKLRAALEIVTLELKNRGYENCCQLCGSSNNNGIYYAYEGAAYLCENCSREYTANAESVRNAYESKRENTVGGTVGAILGSLIGAAAIIIISRLGYVAALSGLIMGVCALKGYELLGGKITKKGVIISCVIMALTVFFSYQLDYAFYLAEEFSDYSVFECFNIMNSALFTGEIVMSAYLPELILLYVFTALGAVPTVMGNLKKQKSIGTFYRLDTPFTPEKVSTAVNNDFNGDSE